MPIDLQTQKKLYIKERIIKIGKIKIAAVAAFSVTHDSQNPENLFIPGSKHFL